MAFVVWGPWVFYLCDRSPVPDKKAEKRGGAFLPNFQESLFLAWNYTLGTNFVPDVLKKVLSVTQLMRYRPI